LARKRTIAIGVPPDLAEFWEIECNTLAISRSAWLSRLLAVWKMTGVEPHSAGPVKNDSRLTPKNPVGRPRKVNPAAPVNPYLQAALRRLEGDE
jgi:hypothetical protein